MVAGLDDASWLTLQTPVCTGALLLPVSRERDGSCLSTHHCAQRSAMQHSPTYTVLPLAPLQKETHGTTPP